MRVGLVRYKYDQAGGAEATLAALGRGLAEAGHQPHAIVAVWQGVTPQGLTVHRVKAGGGKAARMRAFAASAAARARELDLDTWLSLERVPGCPVFRAGDGCHAAWLAHRAPHETALKRLSFGLNPLHRAHLDLERCTLASPALRRVIAPSRLVAAELASYHGLAAEKVRVVVNGVDAVALAPARDPEVRRAARVELGLGDRPALLFLGSGWERKGLAFALAALAGLPGAVLLVAGKDRVGPWRARADRLGVLARTRFLGQRSDAPRLLAAADAAILPTIYDPCANSTLESLAAGLPTVTTAANGAAELIEPGLGGLVVADPADAPALARALQRALAMPRGFASPAPGRRQWLAATLDVLAEAAQETS